MGYSETVWFLNKRKALCFMLINCALVSISMLTRSSVYLPGCVFKGKFPVDRNVSRLTYISMSSICCVCGYSWHEVEQALVHMFVRYLIFFIPFRKSQLSSPITWRKRSRVCCKEFWICIPRANLQYHYRKRKGCDDKLSGGLRRYIIP